MLANTSGENLLNKPPQAVTDSPKRKIAPNTTHIAVDFILIWFSVIEKTNILVIFFYFGVHIYLKNVCFHIIDREFQNGLLCPIPIYELIAWFKPSNTFNGAGLFKKFFHVIFSRNIFLKILPI